MMEWLNEFLLRMTDPVLGWLLWLPRDVALIVVAIGTSLILTLTRKWTTDQNWLKRADQDKKRLDVLIREARKAGDKAAMTRCKQTKAQIHMRGMRYEGRPLLWALLPVALLATWCFARIAYLPPRDGEMVTVKVCAANSAVGRVMHLVPCAGIESEGGWVRAVEPDRPAEIRGWWARANAWVQGKLGWGPVLEGAAVWNIRAQARPEPYVLTIAHDGDTRELPFRVGDRRYEPPQQLFAEGPIRSIEVQLKPVKLFGVVPGVDCIALAPWLVAYLLIAIPAVMVFRRVLSIY